MNYFQRMCIAVVTFVLVGSLYAQEPLEPRSPDTISGPTAGLSLFPTPTFDSSGRLWLAFIEGNVVYVTSSDDQGESFSTAVAVNTKPEKIDANGEGRPKIIATTDGTLLITWTQKLKKRFSGLIRFSRSTNGGKSFSTPITVNDDGIITGHRFDALAIAPSGEILVAWIDKRDRHSAHLEGDSYAGAAIYVAVSSDGGQTFKPNRKLKDHICECCRMSFAFDSSGKASLLFRDLFDNGMRDHSLAQGVGESSTAQIHRVTFDDWKINACPHHGPSFWIDSRDVYHITWFTAGDRSGTGVFYARSTDGGRTFPEPTRVGTERATHPFILGLDSQAYLVWKEVDGQGSTVKLQASNDAGKSWSSATTVAAGTHGADHPLLVSNGQEVFLSWFTKDAGYRFIQVSEKSSAQSARESSQIRWTQ